METLQSTIFIEFDVNTKKIAFLRKDNIIDYDSNVTNIYVRVKYKDLTGNTIYLTPSELEGYDFVLYTIKPTTNNVNEIIGKVTDELKENTYGGIVKFEIPRACTNRLGIVKCEIHINQWDKMIASSTFILDVKQSLVTEFNDSLLDDEDFPVLQQLILEIQKASNINDNAANPVTTYSSDKIETIKEDLNSQIKKKANESDLVIERKRIDSFTRLAEGSTTGDAELQDIRIGANGQTYNSAGEAVRSQLSHYNEFLGNIKEYKSKGKDLLIDYNLYPESEYIFKLKSYTGDYFKNVSVFLYRSDETYVQLKIGGKGVFKLGDKIQFKVDENFSKIKFYVNQTQTETNKSLNIYFGELGDTIMQITENKNKIEQLIQDYTNFISHVPGVNKNDDTKSEVGCYAEDKSYNASSNYRHNEITVNTGDTVRGIAAGDINYKAFVLLDSGKNIIGVTSKAGEYPVKRVTITINDVQYFYYELEIPSGVTSVYYQYEKSLENVADMMTINEQMPTIYTPFEIIYKLNDTIKVDKSNISEKAKTIESVLKNKKIGFIGDSFTDVSYYYGKKISDRTGCLHYNYGKQGSRISLENTVSGNPVKSFIYRALEITEDLDVISIFGGINDASKTSLFTTDLGTINDNALTEEELSNNTVPTTFYSAMKTLCEVVMRKFPEKKILIVIPPHVLDESYTPSITSYRGIETIIKAEREVAEFYGIPVCDLYKNCMEMNNFPNNVANYRIGHSNDIHPNDKGQYSMSVLIQKSLESLFV